MTASAAIAVRNWSAASGKSGIAYRKNPKVPIFRRTPARITDPAVGASVCASGSQVWSGNIGTFTAKASAKARKSQRAASGVTWRARRAST